MGQEGKGATGDEVIGRSMDMSFSEFQEAVRGREAWRAGVHRVAKSPASYTTGGKRQAYLGIRTQKSVWLRYVHVNFTKHRLLKCLATRGVAKPQALSPEWNFKCVLLI